MVDEAYTDRTEWIKKSIRTAAKVSSISLPSEKVDPNTRIDGQVQL